MDIKVGDRVRIVDQAVSVSQRYWMIAGLVVAPGPNPAYVYVLVAIGLNETILVHIKDSQTIG